ncbi:hypothetical protein Gotur_003824, partial [Gossypium turneri]
KKADIEEQGHDRVIILTDNLEAVKVICDRNSDVSTNTLAKMAFVNKENLYLFEDSPLEIQ